MRPEWQAAAIGPLEVCPLQALSCSHQALHQQVQPEQVVGARAHAQELMQHAPLPATHLQDPQPGKVAHPQALQAVVDGPLPLLQGEQVGGVEPGIQVFAGQPPLAVGVLSLQVGRQALS